MNGVTKCNTVFLKHSKLISWTSSGHEVEKGKGKKKKKEKGEEEEEKEEKSEGGVRGEKNHC